MRKKKNSSQAEKIWIRIKNSGNVLIILDDVWDEINLEAIGIQHGSHDKGRCCVLLTTREDTVCSRMECQKTIRLEELSEEEAVDLFLHHASKSGKDCPRKLKFLATKIVNRCGKLPVIVIAVAKTFGNCEPDDWEDVFTAIENYSSIGHGKFYDSLKMSFERLGRKAQDLILLCSTFPRTYEIPVELLVRIAIGSGICGNDVDSYYKARSEVLLDKIKLTCSALLMTAPKGCVRMHDVIREVVQHIADGKIQEIKNSETKLKESAKYSSWSLNDFSNHLEGKNLEVLLGWVNADGSLKVPDTFFEGMTRLRVLLLCSTRRRTMAPSLPTSIRSLENIQTLSLTNWDLDDISIFQNLKNLQSLDLKNCSILELPNGFNQLEKLRLLSLVSCSIKRNDPFEVIGRCLKLEVLYYVSNDANPSKITDLQEFRIYHIEGLIPGRYFDLDASTKRYFNSTNLEGVFSNSTIKSLVAKAEILELTACEETGWTNLVPDMVHPKEDGAMNELKKLHLKSWPALRCLINTNDIQTDASILCDLVEMRLSDMHVRELCYGGFPKDSLKQLEKLEFSGCVGLEGTLFKDKLELSNVKSITLRNCSMQSLFDLSTAQTLNQLENILIDSCSELRCLVSDNERSEVQKVRAHHVFPNLQQVFVLQCNNLECLFPTFYPEDLENLEYVRIMEAEKMKHVFGKCHVDQDHNVQNELNLPALKKLQLGDVPIMVSICAEKYFVKALSLQDISLEECPQLPVTAIMDLSADAQKIEEDLSKTKGKGKKGFTCLQTTKASKAKSVSSTGCTAHGHFPPPSYQFNLRRIQIHRLSQLKSLFTISIASSLMLLEELRVMKCDALEHILVTDECYNSDGHMKVHSILPKLKVVFVLSCHRLEYLFPAFYAKDFNDLERVSIWQAEKMKHVFGKCEADQYYNVQSEQLNLPRLKSLQLRDVPDMVSICAENYYVELLYLELILLEGCLQLPKTLVDFLVGGHKKRQEGLSKRKALSFKQKGKALSNNWQHFRDSNFSSWGNLSMLVLDGCKQLKFIFSASTMRSMPELRLLELSNCDDLVRIIEDDDEEENQNHQECFQKLHIIRVTCCKKLKCLFSISTCPQLPSLWMMRLEDDPELEQVFEGKRGSGPQELVMKDVFPNLAVIGLKDLPNLHTIYQGIDFQTVKLRLVSDCNNISLPCLRSSEIDEYIKVLLPQEKMNFLSDQEYVETRGWLLWHARLIQEQEEDESKQKNAPPDLSNKEVEKDSTIIQKKQKRSSPNLAGNTETSTNEIVEEQVSSPSNAAATPSSSKSHRESCEKESMVDQQALGESGSFNNESSSETSKQESLKIPPSPLIEMISTSSSSISSPKKPHIASSAIHKEMEPGSSQSDLSTISTITGQSAQHIEVSKTEIEEEQLPTSNIEASPTQVFDREIWKKESKGDHQDALGEGRSLNEGPLRLKEPTNELFAKETVSTNTEMTSPPDPSISTPNPKKPHTATSTIHTEQKSSQSDLISECPQVESTVNCETFTDEEKIKFEEHDLMKLIQMMKEGADMEADLSYVTKLIADLQNNQEVTNALSDLEASLKMTLNEIASSEESRLRLHSALNTLSSLCSEDGASSHGLQVTIQSLQQEIQTILSSFSWAYATNDTFTKLEQKKKLMLDERSKREKDAKTLFYEINNTKNSIVEAQLNEAELKEKISKLQEEIGEYQRRLLLLQGQEKTSVSDTIGFEMEFLAMENERSHMEEDQMKARQQLETMKANWSYCLSKLKKATMLLGVHLKQKL